MYITVINLNQKNGSPLKNTKIVCIKSMKHDFLRLLCVYLQLVSHKALVRLSFPACHVFVCAFCRTSENQSILCLTASQGSAMLFTVALSTNHLSFMWDYYSP